MTAFSQADLLALLRKLLPEDYYDTLIAGAGGEILYGQALAGARDSTATQRLFEALTAGTALFGTRATGTVTLTRTGSPACTLLADSVLWDVHGEQFTLDGGATWAADDLTPRTVAVTSVRRSWQANLRPDTVLGVRVALDTVNGLVQPVALADRSIVGAVVSLAGGKSPDLEEQGKAKGISPMVGETEKAFRKRLRMLADIVTPAAIRRHAVAVVPEALVYEEWQLAAFAGVGETDGWFTDGVDDPAALDAGQRTYEIGTGSFVVRIPQQPIDDDWFFADYAYADYAYCPLYLAGLSYDGTTVYDFGYIGTDPVSAQMIAEIEAARAAGVRWTLEEY